MSHLIRQARVNSGSRFERMTSEEPTTSPTSPTATSKDLPTSTIADEVQSGGSLS